MNEDDSALAKFNGLTRLFPLPNLVLFPQVIQGLHIFEPRYRQMMADTIASDLLITMVLIRPGWEKEVGDSPAIYPIGCLGRICQYEQLPDGRYNLHLKGLCRVRILDEIPTTKLYRVAKSELISNDVPETITKLAELRKLLADAVLPRFPSDGAAHHQLRELFEGDTPLAPLCDMLAYALPLPLEMKQQLLEEPQVAMRAEIMASALKVRSKIGNRKFPPDFSIN